MAKLTASQERAVLLEGKNILVSAGAGSGKTTVLSQRVIRKLQQGTHIDELMIVTFTNAAAAEMKHRIIKRIHEASLTQPELLGELDRIENAIISTFDSFALRIVKEYHYLLGLPSRIEIANQPYVTILKEQILDQLIEECYVQPTPLFEKVVSTYFNKGDKAIRDGLLTLVHGAEMAPNKETFFTSLAADQFSDTKWATLLEQMNEIIRLEIDNLRRQTYEVSKVYERYLTQLAAAGWSSTVPDFTPLRDQLAMVHDFDDIMIAIQDGLFKLPSLAGKLKNEEIPWALEIHKAHKKFNDHFAKLTNQMKDLHAGSSAELRVQFQSTRPIVEWMAETAHSYYQRVKAMQFEQGLYDFNDIMDLAIQLLAEHPHVQTAYRDRFQEIMVDEYQDTNDLQNHLLSLIKKENNLFLVGDVKQSIYGFRNANPEHFVTKLKQFATDRVSEVISLKENFRSRRSVIEPINDLFHYVMDETIGGVDYTTDQQLVYGLTGYDHSPEPEQAHTPRMVVVPKHETKTDAEMEAQWIAADIARKLQSSFPTMEDQQFVPLQYKHFAILIDRRSDFDTFAQALKAWGIPVQVYADESYVASIEVLVILNLLKAVVSYTDSTYFNEHFSMALYGLARSFLFHVPDEILVNFLLDHPQLHFNDKECLAMIPALQPIHQLLTNLANLVTKLPLSEWMLVALQQSSFTEKMLQLDDVQSVEMKVDFFLTQTATIPGLDVRGLIDLLVAIEQHPDLDIEFQKAIPPHQNAVTIMTIHKSKGLEYPHVYFPRLDKQFQFSENKSPFVYDRHIGLITKPYENGFYDTIAHRLVYFYAYRTMISERLRLLYVALTRTREAMTLTMTEKYRVSASVYNDANGLLHPMLRMKLVTYSQLLNLVDSWNQYLHPYTMAQPQLIGQSSSTSSHTYTPLQFIDVSRKSISVTRRSYSKSLPMDPVDPQLLLAGELFHEQLEHIDLSSDTPLDGLVEPIRSSVSALLQTPPLAQRKQGKFYHEYPFINEDGVRGIIDLLIEYPDELVIIDFKLSDIDKPEYVTQVQGYMEFIRTISNKKVSGYLYSLTQKYLFKI